MAGGKAIINVDSGDLQGEVDKVVNLAEDGTVRLYNLYLYFNTALDIFFLTFNRYLDDDCLQKLF